MILEAGRRMVPGIAVMVEDHRWATEISPEALAAQAIAEACAFVDDTLEGHEVTVLFADDETVRALNVAHRGKDAATNVLSFPAAPMPRPAGADAQWLMPFGDIVLAFETVAREAELDNKSFQHHVVHLVVHGFLHLAGFDHENDDDAEEMEQLERDILARLEIPDPYALL